MCIHDIAEAETARQVVYEQVKDIKNQQKIGTPSEHIKIRCGCSKYVNWLYMHRCLYCSVFFCKECAEQHFGKTVAERRADSRSGA